MPPKGSKTSEETKQKIRESRLGKPSWNKGLHFSEESKQKMSEAKKGKKMSEGFKKKRSDIMSEKWKDPTFREDMIEKHSGENHYNFGGHLSEERRKQISEFAKNRTDGHMEKLRQMNIGKKATEESREKMSIARLGKPFSEEHKQAIRESYNNKNLSEYQSSRMKTLWDNPEYREKLITDRIEKYKNPEDRQKMTDMVIKRWDLQKSQEINNAWYGDIKYYYGPQYCEKWTEDLKERVRAYFGYQCIECGTPQNGKSLHVHHVWYNKRLCCDDTPRSLVPLCSSCHSKTNTNRDYWSDHFQEMIDAFYDGKCWFTKEEMKAILK
jgi:hypothetical protein